MTIYARIAQTDPFRGGELARVFGDQDSPSDSELTRGPVHNSAPFASMKDGRSTLRPFPRKQQRGNQPQ
jgi:hypothetical protein